jgi:hypothetical protein
VQRCRALVHVIDGTSPDPIGDYKAIQLELELFNPELREKPQVRGHVPGAWSEGTVCLGGWVGAYQKGEGTTVLKPGWGAGDGLQGLQGGSPSWTRSSLAAAVCWPCVPVSKQSDDCHMPCRIHSLLALTCG